MHAEPAPDRAQPAEIRLPLAGPLDLRRTLGLLARGRSDPCLRFEVSGSVWRATRTADGPATLFIELVDAGADGGAAGGAAVRARAWGAGAGAALEGVPALLGLDDNPGVLAPGHDVLAEAARRLRGMRIGRTGAVLEALVPAILEQKITGEEARHVYRGLVRVFGAAAPGPAGEAGLRLPPDPAALAAAPYYAYHPLGLERRRAELIRAVAREAPRLERLVDAPLPHAYAALRAFPGIGPWTAAEVGARAFGDPDAVSVGDVHIPNMVCWALASEPRGTDERMLELLEPYRGQRGRVIRLLEASGASAPRRGPRMPTRRIGGL